VYPSVFQVGEGISVGGIRIQIVVLQADLAKQSHTQFGNPDLVGMATTSVLEARKQSGADSAMDREQHRSAREIDGP